MAGKKIRRKHKIDYKEGDCFSVPLCVGDDDERGEGRNGYGRGVVTRMDGSACIFGHFFGPKIAKLADVRVDSDLSADNALFSYQFGALGLMEDEWQVVGSVPGWSRDEWPMPEVFLNYSAKAPYGLLEEYDEDTLESVGSRRIELSAIDVDSFHPDGLLGYGAVEYEVTRLISLQQEMAEGKPIKVPGPFEGDLGPVRSTDRRLLRKHGWTLEESTGFWMPPR